MKRSSDSRRDFIKKSALVTAGLIAVSKLPAGVVHLAEESSQFTLPKLDYAYDALEPYIDAKTMEIHHSKHHQAYVNNLNKALTENKITGTSLNDLVKNISGYPAAIRNNAGGHWNHSFFWNSMMPLKKIIVTGEAQYVQKLPSKALEAIIKADLGSFEQLKTRFTDAAKSVFGSGWAWLVVNKDKKLEIGTTPNQDNPLMDVSSFKGIPILALDVWEHAYYLKHMNLRADYISDWWNLVNWEHCDQLYPDAIK